MAWLFLLVGTFMLLLAAMLVLKIAGVTIDDGPPINGGYWEL